MFDKRGRRPWASVNFVTAHDGFTLMDTVSYNDKHNEANSEDNRDGHSDNRSWNCGAEGETDDAEILALRDKMRRAMMATLLLSQGTPMLLMGDEIGRTQGGNNNAYCQDNEMNWLNLAGVDERERCVSRVPQRRSSRCAARARFCRCRHFCTRRRTRCRSNGYVRTAPRWRKATGTIPTAGWSG